MLRVTVLLLLLLNIDCFAAIGTITEEKGSGEIVRNKSKLDAKLNGGVESLDSILTAKGIIGKIGRAHV